MLTEQQLATLNVVCDTIVPSIERSDDEHGTWGRSAADLGADAAVAEAISGMEAEGVQGLAELLDVLERQHFSRLSQASREQSLRTLSLASRDAALGIAALTALTLFFAYGIPPNPVWAELGFPGPVSAPPDVPKPIVPLRPGRR